MDKLMDFGQINGLVNGKVLVTLFTMELSQDFISNKTY